MEKITIDFEGDVETHIANTGGGPDYATACGQALDGDEFSGTELPTPRGAKITCFRCHAAWLSCRGARATDFDTSL